MLIGIGVAEDIGVMKKVIYSRHPNLILVGSKG